ncbi:MAG: ArsA family ATPase, partial [Parcubacteria group bacterium]|nr:ArsA family ATPase [Parcubacteria group bacterium]
AASAIRFAEKGRKTLIFTTDPAPSLGDSFGQTLSNEPVAIKDVKNLYAMEVDAKKVLEEFKEEYGEEVLDILQKGTYLADEEVEEIFSLDIPGLDEVMGLKKIVDFMESEEYDLYIVDTAPTGHTLRLLTLPELLDNWIKFLAKMRWRYHYMIKRISGEERKEKADQFLLEMKKTVKRVRELLQDAQRTEFVVATIPTEMAIRETEDLVNDLQKFHIPSGHIIINNIVPKARCEFCKARRKEQKKYIKEINRLFSRFNITEVTLQPEEIKGVKKLDQLTKSLF